MRKRNFSKVRIYGTLSIRITKLLSLTLSLSKIEKMFSSHHCNDRWDIRLINRRISPECSLVLWRPSFVGRVRKKWHWCVCKKCWDRRKVPKRLLPVFITRMKQNTLEIQADNRGKETNNRSKLLLWAACRATSTIKPISIPTQIIVIINPMRPIHQAQDRYAPGWLSRPWSLITPNDAERKITKWKTPFQPEWFLMNG